jgi:hypothetical protein
MLPETENSFVELPTGKKHVSFSEYRDWSECSYRHYLKNVKKLAKEEASLVMDYGTAVHSVCEHYLKNRIIDLDIGKTKLTELFNKNSVVEVFKDKYDVKFFNELQESFNDIFTGFEEYMESNFPGWEYVEAEHELYEHVSDDYKHAFKGFIDCIIRIPHKKGFKYWVIDWKTTTWGWSGQKKNDALAHRQLILYRSFWSKKSGVPIKDIKCAFSLFKRTAKPGKKHELVKISVGDITTERAIKGIRNMFSSVSRGIKLKNRDSCKYCPFLNTEHCR